MFVITIALFLFGSVSAAQFKAGSLDHDKSYGYQVTDEFSRNGGASERFEVRYGDCKGEDCYRDRQRYEVGIEQPYKERDNWYSWSFYLPDNFMIQPAGTAMGQAKLLGRGAVLWMVFAKNTNYIQIKSDTYEQHCNLIKTSDAVGKWTDIMIRANYSPVSKNPLSVWINGKNVGCDYANPLVDEKGLQATEVYKKGFDNEIKFQYGIYQAFISRWLDKYKTKEVSGDVDIYYWKKLSGKCCKSPDNTPFNEDWGIETPTAVMYYDEVKVGNSRGSVNSFYDSLILDSEALTINETIKSGLNHGSFIRFDKVRGDTEYGYTVSDDITKKSPTNKIEIFEIRSGDCVSDDCDSDKERVQLMQQPRDNHLGDEHWYGWNIFYPEGYIDISPSKTMTSSFEQKNSAKNWMFGSKNGEYLLVHKPNGTNRGKIKQTLVKGENLRGKWHKVEVHSKWSNDESGFFKVWVNGKQKVDYLGRTMTEGFNHFRYGIARLQLSRYKEEYDTNKVPTQRVYFSNVKRADTRKGLKP